jgi:hypothetical protein
MAEHPTEVLSPAQVLQLIRDKISRHLLSPVVSEKMDAYKRAKSARAAENPDKDYRTVFHADLIHAVLNGSVVDLGPCCEGWWTVTIRGVDRCGEQLVVIVEVTNNDEPFMMSDFSIDL